MQLPVVASLSICVLLVLAQAVPGTEQKVLGTDDPNDPDYRPKVAIIGTGMTGASAAYTLQEITLQMQAPPLLTVFEQNSNIGGRVASTFAHGEVYQNIEAGATAFSSNDWCILKAISNVGLDITSYGAKIGQQTAVWNGSSFSPHTHRSWYPKTWTEYARGLWRYGIAFHRLTRLVSEVQYKYSQFPSISYSTNMTEILARAHLTDESTTSAQTYLSKALGNDNAIIDEVIEPLVRAKLSANLEDITALAALIALAPGDLLEVRTGNWRILNRLIRLSEAKIQTNARVTSLRQATRGGWLVEYSDGNSDDPAATSAMGFDFVILTADLQNSGIRIELAQQSDPTTAIVSENVNAMTRHVTYFTSERRLDPRAFNQDPEDALPENILTTGKGAGEFGVYSIMIPSVALPANPGDCIDHEELLYRAVSDVPLPDHEIARLFGLQEFKPTDSLEDIGVTWIDRHSWPHAFQQFRKPLLLDNLQLVRGLYYAAANEEIVSSLELACRMGTNAAQALYSDRMAPEPYPY